MSPEQIVVGKRDSILRIAAQHGARNVRLFGSVARGEASEGSDLDILVAMEPGCTLPDLAALRNNLKDLLSRDVVTDSGLYWLLRRKILRETRPL